MSNGNSTFNQDESLLDSSLEESTSSAPTNNFFQSLKAPQEPQSVQSSFFQNLKVAEDPSENKKKLENNFFQNLKVADDATQGKTKKD